MIAPGVKRFSIVTGVLPNDDVGPLHSPWTNIRGKVPSGLPNGGQLAYACRVFPGGDTMDTAEPTRQFPRHPVQCPIRYRAPGVDTTELSAGWTRNLSEGGLGLELPERLPPATRLRLWLFTDEGSLAVEGQVVWEAAAPQGSGGILHGVAFAPLRPEQVEALRRLISAQKMGHRAGPRFPLQCPLTGQGPAGPVEGATANVSRGGLLLRLTLALPLGAPLGFSLRTPQGVINGTGEVVWVEPPAGPAAGAPISHGLRFTALGWTDAYALAVLVTDTYLVPSPPEALAA
jgi:hypothetical protein